MNLWQYDVVVFFFFKIINSGMENGSVVFWDIRGKGDPVRYLLEQTNSIWDVSFSPDGRFLTSIDLQGELVIWSTEVNQY
jgi:WD40 repeat protein